ncbi:hypothetical protein HAX54_019351, partial [Datura stramonium]|nr:hypothetical protein [Datura stramonium]
VAQQAAHLFIWPFSLHGYVCKFSWVIRNIPSSASGTIMARQDLVEGGQGVDLDGSDSLGSWLDRISPNASIAEGTPACAVSSSVAPIGDLCVDLKLSWLCTNIL